MLFGLGAIAAARRLRIPRAALHLLATGLLAVVAAAIEVVQVFLPGKNADPTDWVLEVLGGVAGYACAWWLARVRTVGADAVPGSAQRDR
jgi:VanZ family protein